MQINIGYKSLIIRGFASNSYGYQMPRTNTPTRGFLRPKTMIVLLLYFCSTGNGNARGSSKGCVIIIYLYIISMI